MAAGTGEASKNGRPNIIWITLDACRASHLSCYGYERETSPNIDALARKGTVFESNFSQMYATTYSVPSFMTGRYFPSPSIGFMDWQSMWRTPPAHEMLFPSVLNDAGYKTAIATCLAWFPGSRLWDEFSEGMYINMTRPELGYAEFREINDTIFQWLSNQEDDPFFLYIHVLDTHFPHKPVSPFNKLPWIPDGMTKYAPPYSKKEQAYLRGIYDASILYADQEVGRLLNFLDEQGLSENTVMVIGSDHGDLLGEDGKTIDHPAQSPDELYHVPMIMKGPGIPEGKRIQHFSENVDIVPTLMDLVSVEDIGVREGRSLVDLMRDSESTQPRENVVSAIRRANDVNFLLRNRRYKYEWNPRTGLEHLWQVPDHWGHRLDVLNQHADIAKKMRAEVEERLVPLWAEYLALPQTSPVPFSLHFGKTSESAEAWTTHPSGSTTDNKWLVSRGYIKSEPTEDPLPITFEYEVPPGPYEVQIRLRVGTPMAVKVQDDVDFSVVRLEQGRNQFDYVPIGEYKIDSGILSITLKKGTPGELAWARGLRMIPLWAASGTKPSAEDLEQLESLGYLQ